MSIGFRPLSRPSPLSYPSDSCPLADGAFALLMKELGIPPPDLPQQPTDLDLDWFKWLLDHLGKSRKGTSTLRKWTCTERGLNAWFRIKANP